MATIRVTDVAKTDDVSSGSPYLLVTKDITKNNVTVHRLRRLSVTDLLAEADSGTRQIDSVPTSGSENMVRSGGVYSALSAKQNAVSGKGLSTNDYTAAAKVLVDAFNALMTSGNNGKLLAISNGAPAVISVDDILADGDSTRY